jgi:thioredoxin-related protein
MKVKTFALFTAAMLVAMSSLSQASEGWTDDFEAAKAQAEKEGKDLLLDFTGSDWCGWCIKLHKEVFDQDAFKKDGPKNFILVEVDFPRGKKLADKTKAQNDKLVAELGVQGYPTIYLTDSKGRPYARTGYQPGGPEKYLAHLAELRKVKTQRDELFSKAEKSNGAEKAKYLDEALTQLEKSEISSGYDDVIAQIIAADTDNKGGFKSKYDTRKKLEGAVKKAEGGNMDGALADIDALIKQADLTPAAKQQSYYIKAMLMHHKGDAGGTLENLELSQKADPTSDRAKEMGQIIEQLKAAKNKK